MSDRDLFVGREVAPETGKTGDEPVRLDADDLTTHGLIVGMTGSGKTALGIVLIEELLQRGVPVLAIDPKGDLSNLLLDFPSLSAEEFAPFVDASGGATAESEARKWQDGLASWGLSAADVARLLASREASVYSPGGSAGTPLDILGSLAPPSATAGDEERREVAATFLLGLLGLAGIDADPVRSREFILLSKCVEALWEKSETATPEALVSIAAAPPFATVGALPLESFFPAKERQELVLSLNNLVTSPTLRSFPRGAPLSIERMLGGSSGKAKLSVASVRALSERGRVFPVAAGLSSVGASLETLPGG